MHSKCDKSSLTLVCHALLSSTHELKGNWHDYFENLLFN